MSRWQRRVDDLLYDGETVRESLDVGTARVVVTSHRVLAFTPELDGENFRQTDRPNVTGVDTGTRSTAWLLRRGIVAGTVGAVLALAGLLFDPESVFGQGIDLDTGAATNFGLGGLMEVTRSMFALLLNLDAVLLSVGALALLLATVLLGVYWYLRTPTLVVELAGDEGDLHVPRPEDASEVANRLERAILPDPRETSRGVDGDAGVGGDAEATPDDGFVDDSPAES